MEKRRTMRLIDGDALETKVQNEIIDGHDEMVDAVREAPTVVNALLARFGVWQIDKITNVTRCSECGEPALCWIDGKQFRSDYCPLCGAIMVGEEQEE